MLVGEVHVGGKESCWWRRIMLVGKDHAGGERSCWWERIMLVLQDEEERRNVVFAPKKSTFS